MLNAALVRAQGTSGANGAPVCPVVLEVTPTLVDRPAELTWLSQYPGEMDTAFPALTGIETTGYRVDDLKGGAVLVIETTPIVTKVTFDEVETHKKRLVTDARDVLVQSLEEAFSRVHDCPLPFTVEISGAGERGPASRTGSYSIRLFDKTKLMPSAQSGNLINLHLHIRPNGLSDPIQLPLT